MNSKITRESKQSNYLFDNEMLNRHIANHKYNQEPEYKLNPGGLATYSNLDRFGITQKNTYYNNPQENKE